MMNAEKDFFNEQPSDDPQGNHFPSVPADADYGESPHDHLDDEPGNIVNTEAADEDETCEDAPAGPLRKVQVDWVELEGALENNSPELHSFLNIAMGEVVRILREEDLGDRQLREAEANPDFFYIEPISSREQYRWMEEFIEIVEDPTLKDKLNIAIDGKGAFRRFKDVLMAYHSERELWFTKRTEKLRARMVDWLRSKGLEGSNPMPPEGETGHGATGHHDSDRDHDRGPGYHDHYAGGPPRGGMDYDRRYRRDPGVEMRDQAHELLDLIPSRELPTAISFLEFLRSRRGYRRYRY